MIGALAFRAALVAAFSGAKERLSRAWDWLAEKPWRGMMVLLLLSICANVASCRKVESQARQIAAMESAQKTAAHDQGTVNHFPVLQSKAIAEKSDADAASYYEAGRRAGAAYAAAHPAAERVRCPAAAAGPADLPGANRPAPVDDRPGDTADMVAVSRADFDLLTHNSLRLAKVPQDANTLIEAGAAVELVP